MSPEHNSHILLYTWRFKRWSSPRSGGISRVRRIVYGV